MLLTASLLLFFAPEPASAHSGDRVVFASNRDGTPQVWLAEPGESGPRRLTGGEPAYFPRCSPDGLLLVFERGSPGAREIWVQDIASGAERRIAVSAAEYSTPEWMPDQTSIVFTQRVGNFDRIALAPLDGTGPVQPVTEHPWNDVMPSPTPDGQGLVFHSYRHGRDNTEIYHRDLSSGQERRVTHADGQDYEAATDGRRVVFSSDREGGRYHLYLGDLEGGVSRRLTTGETDAWGGRFGRRGILFGTGPAGVRKPHVVDEDGTVRPLWTGPHDDYSPAWCPLAAAY